MKFLKGKKAFNVIAKQEKEQKEKEEARLNEVRRFWLPNNSDKEITFLDGDLDGNGLLDINMYHEHNVFEDGHWRNWYVCVGESEPCPLCEDESRSSFVGLLTVVEHDEYKDIKGNLHKNEIRMFVAKRDTIKQLQKYASKRGGLSGWRVAVSRSGDKSPSVGNIFDFVRQYDEATLKKALKGKWVIDYSEAVNNVSAAGLRKLGYGTSVVGAEAVGADDDDDDDDDFADTPKKSSKGEEITKQKKPPSKKVNDDFDDVFEEGQAVKETDDDAWGLDTDAGTEDKLDEFGDDIEDDDIPF